MCLILIFVFNSFEKCFVTAFNRMFCPLFELIKRNNPVTRKRKIKKIIPEIRSALFVQFAFWMWTRIRIPIAIANTNQETGEEKLKILSANELLIRLNIHQAIKNINRPRKTLPDIFSSFFSTWILLVKIENQCVNANSIPIGSWQNLKTLKIGS